MKDPAEEINFEKQVNVIINVKTKILLLACSVSKYLPRLKGITPGKSILQIVSIGQSI